jgi:hypothetical protein
MEHGWILCLFLFYFHFWRCWGLNLLPSTGMVSFSSLDKELGGRKSVRVLAKFYWEKRK